MKTEIVRVGGVTETVFGPVGVARDLYYRLDQIAERMEILRIERLPFTGDHYRYLVTGK